MSNQDTRVYDLPGYDHLKEKGYKIIKYNHTLQLVGPDLTTRVIDEIKSYINSEKSVVIAITGPPGQGKTYAGIRFAQKIDSKFHINDIPPPDPYTDDGQITFSREHIAYLTGENSPLVRGQVILTDESHWGIGARTWYDKDQQDVVNYLAAIRSKGFILIIVVLHTRMIDSLLRDFVLNYEFNVTMRGEATIYRRWFPVGASEPWRKKIGSINLNIPDSQLCDYDSCLRGKNGCKWLHGSDPYSRCMTIRAIYERRKEWFLNMKGKKDKEQQEASNYTNYEVIEEFALKNIENIGNTQEGVILWMRESGFKVRARDGSPYAKRILALKE